MSFASDSCWDCPIAVSSLVLIVLVTTGMLALAVWLCTRRRIGVRALGWILLVPTLLWLVSAARVFPRWGVVWHIGRAPDIWDIHPLLDRVVIYGWAITSIVAGTLMWRRLAKRA